MRLVTLSLIALLAPQAGQTLTLEAPQKSKPEELATTAAAVVSRCKAYGYAGIAATVKDGKIRISSKDGLTDDMVARIRGELCAHQFQSVSLLLSYELTAGEREQYKEPQFKPGSPKISPAKSPSGTNWMAYRYLGSASETYFLAWSDFTLENQEIAMAEAEEQWEKDPRMSFALTPAGAEKFRKLPAAARALRLLVVVDGSKAYPLTGTLKEKDGAVTGTIAFRKLPLDASLRYPLQVPIK